MADAGGGLVGKANVGQLNLVENKGDDAADRSDANFVAALQNSCWPSRTTMKRKRETSKLKTTTKIILQGPASARCRSAAEQQQSHSLQSRRLGCCPAKTHVGLHARR